MQLTFMLPLIVMDLVQMEWLPMRNYLLILEIILISHADKIPTSSLGYLDLIIAEYLETFQITYNDTLTPKQHFLQHRCREIAKHGLLNEFKTNRMEGKHQFFKRISQDCRTFKNLALFLARQHQLNQSAILTDPIENEVQTGPLKQTDLLRQPFRRLFPQEDFLTTTSWVKINGVQYTASKCFIAVSYTENLLQFRAVQSIIWQNEEPIFVCQKVKTLELNLAVMAYEIEMLNDFENHSFEDLFSYEAFHAHRQGEQTFIIMKKALGPLY